MARDPKKATANSRRYRARHKAKVLAYEKAYRATHRDEIRERRKALRLARRAEINKRRKESRSAERLEYERRWRATHKAALNRRRRAYYAKHPNLRLVACQDFAKREAAKRQTATEEIDYTKVINDANGVCGICHKPFDLFGIHVDHIVPLARGGTHTYDNLQATHAFCNMSKGAKVG